MKELFVWGQCFLMVLVLFASPPPTFSQENDNSLEYIDVQDESLEDVMRLVANRSGYEILLFGDYTYSNITGNFYLADLESSLHRIFKGTNIFIEFHEKEKKIIVKFPGQGAPVRIPAVNPGSYDDDSGLTSDELLSMREREKRIQLAKMSDPSEVDPDSGITYVEQLSMREREKSVQLATMSDPSEIDPDSGIPYVEQLSMREGEEKIQLTRMSDPSEVDPDVGVPYVEQLSMREREKRVQMERMSDPSEIDPDSGIPYVEQLSMREREKNNWQK